MPFSPARARVWPVGNGRRTLRPASSPPSAEPSPNFKNIGRFQFCLWAMAGVGTLLLCHLAGYPISRLHDQPPVGGGCWFRAGAGQRPDRWRTMEEGAAQVHAGQDGPAQAGAGRESTAPAGAREQGAAPACAPEEGP